MKNYPTISKQSILPLILVISMCLTVMSQHAQLSTRIPEKKMQSLRSDTPKTPSPTITLPKEPSIKQHISPSDSDKLPLNSPSPIGKNLQVENSDKNYLLDKMSQKIKNLQHTGQSTTFARGSSSMQLLKRHENSKISEYVKKVVQNNRKFIHTHNSDSKRPYKLAENRFIIYTSDEFKELFLNLKTPQSNYVRNHPKIEVVVPFNNSMKRSLQEIKIDWKAANRMTSVKFQRQCGSCYAFTAISVIESAYILKGRYLNLAEQELVDCSNPYGNFGCTGGWTTNAYKYIQNFGVVTERDYPYNATANKCTVGQDKVKIGIKNYVELKNDCSLVIEALKNQPLSIAINADGWQYYSRGVYTDCRPGVSNHGVVLAGVDSGSWLIKNSWGYSWGQDGYIRVSRTAPNKACNVCEWASYPVI